MGSFPFIRFILFPVLGVMLLTGCIPESRKPDVVYGPGGTREAAVASMPLLEKRIVSLQDMLAQGTLGEEDREMARDLLSLYEKIRKDALTRPSRHDYPALSRRLLERLLQIEERYYSGETAADQGARDVIRRYAAARKRILDDYLHGNYKGVVDGCLKLESELGPESLTPEIGLVFALSLAKKGMLEEAIGVGLRIASQMEGKPDLLYLQAHITQWYGMLGQREKAIQSYEKLLDNLNHKEALFKTTEKRMASRQSPGPSVEAPRVPPPGTDTRAEDPGSLQAVLEKADALVQNNQFHDAKMLLVTYRITLPDGPEMETLDRAIRSVDMAEQEYLDGEFAREKRFEEALTLARTLVEEERFEKALQELEKLEKERPGDAAVGALKETATERLIRQERNRAAKLYLMARSSSDPAEKEELLLSSYNKLNVLIENYPSSSLINTLKNNITKVREELRKLGVDPG